MRILSQIHHSTLAALGSLTQQKHRSTAWMSIYLLVGVVVFSLFSWLFWQYQDDLKQMLLSYLFPDSWHALSESVVEYFFSTQAKVVLSNLVLGSSLVIASVFLFPLKEKYSAHFESEQHYPNGTPHEFPLIRQAKEEIRLFLFYLTSQLIILWIGYYPFAWAKITSISLSYLALIIMFSMDLISPTFHRHQVGYSRMIIVLMRNPFATLCFGAIYSVPAVLLSYGITRFTELTFLEMSSWLFITNILFICIAIPGGTHVASQLLTENQHVKPFTLSTKRISYALMVILLITFGILHGRLAQSLHHKSQILKAEYEVDWKSFNVSMEGVFNWLQGRSKGAFSFDLTISNPTEFDIVIEKSQVFVLKKEQLISEVNLQGFSIPAFSSRDIPIQLDTKLDTTTLTDWETIAKDWRVDLHVELFPGIPFIVNLYEAQ